MNDSYEKVNPILRTVMKRIYENRVPLPLNTITSVRYERVQDEVFSDVWFMTPGCAHDRKGGCTMCNYGKGHEIDSDIILQELEERVKQLPPKLQELVVTPTGSMLDEREVPEDFRRKILGLFRGLYIHDFLIETRADTISPDKLEDLKTYISADKINIEIGMECCDDWVLRNCVNKNISTWDFKKAVEMIHAAGMAACANVGAGIPFLSERCNIRLAQQTIRRAFDLGFDSVVLFPYHVKPGTLLEWLWRNGTYSCCSLWSLSEIMSVFDREVLNNIQISWYRNYYTDKSKVLTSPDSCEVCREHVLALYDEYRNHPGEQALDALLAYSCGCRDTWKENLMLQSETPEIDKIIEVYRVLGRAFHIPEDMIEKETDYVDKMWEEKKYDENP